MKKGKLFAPFLTLFAVAISLFVMLFNEYKLKDAAIRLLVVLVVFYFIGISIQNRVFKFVKMNEEELQKEAEKEGAVIEKEAPSEEESDEEYSLPPLTGAMPQRPGDDENDFFRAPGE